MQDINELINETDTDNVILNKLKELATKLTGKTTVEGKTICDVLDFITNNYSTSGGSGGISSSVFYLFNGYLYKDTELTTKVTADEFTAAYASSILTILNMSDMENFGTYKPLFSKSTVDENGHDAIKVFIMLENGTLSGVFTGPYKQQSGVQ